MLDEIISQNAAKIFKIWEQENPNRFFDLFLVYYVLLTVDVLDYVDINKRINYYNSKTNNNYLSFLILKIWQLLKFFFEMNSSRLSFFFSEDRMI